VHTTANSFYARQGDYEETWPRREMAARSTVAGSYSPSATNVTRADFFDDVHPHEAVLHVCVERSRGGGPILCPGVKNFFNAVRLVILGASNNLRI
jgi:hypothetical protein